MSDSTTIQSQYQVALGAFRAGHKILPITADGRKIPLIRFIASKKGPSQVPQGEPDVYSLWMEDFPGAGVAYVTGPASHEGSGLLVVDVDVKGGAPGPASLEAAAGELGELPATRTVTTPSGGLHLIYSCPDESEFRNHQGWRDGVDIRAYHGIAGYPGSADARGTYAGDDAPVAQLPAVWLDALRKEPSKKLADTSVFGVRSTLTDPVEQDYHREQARNEVTLLADILRQPGRGKHGRLVTTATALGSWSHLLDDPADAAEYLLRALEQAHTNGEDAGDFDEARSRENIAMLMKNGMVNPKWAPSRGGTFLGNRASYQIPAPVGNVTLSWPSRTWDDYGNAARLGDHHGERLAWLAGPQQWVGYTGTHWTLEGGETVATAAAMATIGALPDTEALNYDDTQPVNSKGEPAGKSERATFLGWVHSQRKKAPTTNMLSLGKAEPRIGAGVDDFDTHPMLLAVRNGVLDLEQRVLLPHDPQYRMTAVSPILYDPDARCPNFEQFLKEVQPDVEVREYLQKVMGYSLTGDTRHPFFFVHTGSGSNGKSVLMDLMVRAGGGYAQTMRSQTIVASAVNKGGDGPNADIARLVGKRFVRAAETQPGVRLDDALIKELTGGEHMTARNLHKGFFDFRPQLKLHISTNHLPNLGGGGLAMERRLRTIEWPVTITAGQVNDRLVAQLAGSELSGILNWLLDGIAMWAADGYRLAQPQAVIESSAEHIFAGDPLAKWLHERVDHQPGAQIEVALLFEDYRSYTERRNEKPMTATSFGLAMKERAQRIGAVKGTDTKSRRATWQNITLHLTAVGQPDGSMLYSASDAQ